MDVDDKKVVSRTKRYEFGGPIGTFFIMFALPATLLAVNLACNKDKCSIRSIPTIPNKLSDYFDMEAVLIYIGWFVFLSFLYMLPVGRVVLGQPTPSGQRLQYRCNAFLSLIVCLLAFGAGVYFNMPLTILYKKFFQLMITAIVFSALLSILLYLKARRASKRNLAKGGNTGNIVYDFFVGHELNPRIGKMFDLKFFCELRPGLIGWVMLNLSFVLHQYKTTNAVDHSLALVTFFQFLYVADALWFEEAILTTMDIIHDGFGFMLAFGDLAWVPFLYCLQTRFLLENPSSLPWCCLPGIFILNLIGYYIFRGSNSQKNEFRKNPNNPALSYLETIPTTTGKRLIVSGWWGLCRKPNYLGDLIMAFSWCLPCGFGSIIPYFYPIYFLILLIHRERRDSANCHKKYKASWDRYCERVKYRIFPLIY